MQYGALPCTDLYRVFSTVPRVRFAVFKRRETFFGKLVGRFHAQDCKDNANSDLSTSLLRLGGGSTTLKMTSLFLMSFRVKRSVIEKSGLRSSRRIAMLLRMTLSFFVSKNPIFLKRLGFLKFGQTAVSLLRLSDNI